MSLNFEKHNDTFKFVERVSMFQTSSSAIQGIILMEYKYIGVYNYPNNDCL